MPDDNPAPESARQKGYRLACEGILRSQFGRRPSRAANRAVEQLRREESDEVIVSFPPARRIPRNLLRPALAIAACLALLIGLNVWLSPRANDQPTMAIAAGSRVTIERNGQSFPAPDGLRLLPGDLLETTTNGPALIIYAREITRIVITSETEVKLMNWKEGKGFELRQGRIEATVAHQPKRRPMVWRTAEAQATVVGTELALEVTTNTTTLEVLDGKVELTSRASGEVIQVTNSQYAIAAPGIELSAKQLLQGRGSILREYWLGIEGIYVGRLTSDARYPNRPDGSGYAPRLAGPTNWGTNYGARFRGYLHPPRTGDYTFWITSSEGAQLFLSSDENPAHAEMVSVLGRSAAPGQWDAYPWQKSDPTRLQAGRKYYIEVLHTVSESSGDHCSVAWRPPGGQREVIPGEFLSPFNVKGSKR